jgi:hypothetical protein
VTHEELLDVVESIVNELLEQWEREQKLEPFALTWPSEPVESDDGKLIWGATICQLKNVPKSAWNAALQQMVEKTKALSMFLVERRDDHIRAIFESHEGARAWLIPLHRHGDLLALGETTVHDDKECIGILWRPMRGEA